MRPAGSRGQAPGHRGQRAGLILGVGLGQCVHVAGLRHFLAIAEERGWETVFLGAAQSPAAIAEAVARLRPDVVGLSYRLSPETAGALFRELGEALREREALRGHRPVLVFGGTGPVCRVAERSGLFARVFPSAATAGEVRAWLDEAGATRSGAAGAGATRATGGLSGVRPVEAGLAGAGLDGPRAEGLVERIARTYPRPIFRHHFGLPDLEATVEGCAILAESGLVDVISLGPDQNTQEHFFHPGEIDENRSGAGGVPIRTAEDFRRLKAASRRGNHPLMRCYSGTRDILRLAAVLRETIDNAWCAVPLFWYSVLDARSRRPLREAIAENLEVVSWHAARGIPVEVNESHHWSLREAPDTVAVAAAFLAAYNAKRRGVRHYVSQYMFDTPAGTAPEMDLGKMLAKIELIEGLHDESFTTFRQTRTGLASQPPNLDEAKGHLAASTYLQLALRPHIVHVVAYCEADHAATPSEIIESVRVVRGVVEGALASHPDLAALPAVQARRAELVAEARELLAAIAELASPGVDDPWSDVETLARAVEIGLLDAPHLAGNPAAKGLVRTRLVEGKCLAVEPGSGRVIPERERIRRALDGAATTAGVARV